MSAQTPSNGSNTSSGLRLTHVNRRVHEVPIIIPALARHDGPVPGIPHDGAAVDLARLAQVVRRLLVVVVRLERAVDVLVAVVQLQPAADARPLDPVLVGAPGAERLEVELVGAVCYAVVEVVIYETGLLALLVRLRPHVS